MNRTKLRTKSKDRTKTPKPPAKAEHRPRRSLVPETPGHNGDGHAGNGQKRGPTKRKASPPSDAPVRPEGSSEGGVATPQPEAVVEPPPSAIAADLLARVRQAASTVPDSKVAEVEEAAGVLRRVVSRALGRGRGADERERKAVLSLLCEEVKPVLLRYELVLEGLSFLERLRLAKTRGAVVSARLAFKGVIASLAAEGAPPDAIEDLTRRVR